MRSRVKKKEMSRERLAGHYTASSPEVSIGDDGARHGKERP